MIPSKEFFRKIGNLCTYVRQILILLKYFNNGKTSNEKRNLLNLNIDGFTDIENRLPQAFMLGNLCKLQGKQ